jgi:hypothetical protein
MDYPHALRRQSFPTNHREKRGGETRGNCIMRIHEPYALRFDLALIDASFVAEIAELVSWGGQFVSGSLTALGAFYSLPWGKRL